MDAVQTITSVVSGVIAIGAILSTMLPGPVPGGNKYYAALYAVTQWCALNKGHAVNLSDPASTGIVGGPGAVSNPQAAVVSKPKP